MLLTLGVMLMLGSGCGIHSPEKVQIVAARAVENPDKFRKLTRALGHRKREVWEEAYGALVELAPASLPELHRSVERRRPEAGRALLVLGELGDPEQLPVIRSLLDHRQFGAFAQTAVELAERQIWENIQEEPDLTLIDGYMTQFPRGPHLALVKEARRELVAWQELEALGRDPQPGALIRIDRLYGDTAAGESARRQLAQSALVQAGREIGRGRASAALQLVEEARGWDPGLDVTAMEAAALAALGHEKGSRNDLDGAIQAMEESLALNGKAHPDLGGLYLERARRRFRRRQPAPAMADLRRAEAVDPSLRDAVDRERNAEVEPILLAVEREGAADDLFAALLLAGRAWWAQLEGVLRAHLSQGRGEPLVAVAHAAWELGDQEDQLWLEAMLTQLLFEVDGAGRGLLDDPQALAMVAGEDPWGAGAAQARADARAVLGAYVAVVEAAHVHLVAGGIIDGALPAAPPRDAGTVQIWLDDGRDPRDAGLPRLDRAQLVLAIVDALDAIEEAALRDPARLVSAAAVQERIPNDTRGWLDFAAGMDRAAARAGLGGQPMQVSVLSRAGTTRVEIAVGDGPAATSEEAIGDALTALFVAGPPLMAAWPTSGRVEVLAGPTHPAYGTLDPWLRLALSRQQLAGLDRDALAEQAPLSRDQLTLVPDRAIR